MEIPFVDIHSHKDDAVIIVAQREMLCAGVHPWHCGDKGDMSSLDAPNVVAIGEIGLDYLCPIDRESQQRLFEKQLEFAQKARLPVVIHCVRAYNQTIATIERYNLTAVIFHSFIGSPQLSRQIISKGYYLSFGSASLKSPKTRSALLNIDQKRLLLESDTGKVAIETIYSEVAVILGIEIEELKELVFGNFKDIFGQIDELVGEN